MNEQGKDLHCQFPVRFNSNQDGAFEVYFTQLNLKCSKYCLSFSPQALFFIYIFIIIFRQEKEQFLLVFYSLI